MTDTNTDTRIVDIKGRPVVVRQLTDAQLILMGRDASTLSREDVPGARKLEAAGFIMDMFESAIVQVTDRAYVMDLTRKGELEMQDFLGFLSAFKEAEPAVKPVVRRGRPPRAK